VAQSLSAELSALLVKACLVERGVSRGRCRRAKWTAVLAVCRIAVKFESSMRRAPWIRPAPEIAGASAGAAAQLARAQNAIEDNPILPVGENLACQNGLMATSCGAADPPGKSVPVLERDLRLVDTSAGTTQSFRPRGQLRLRTKSFRQDRGLIHYLLRNLQHRFRAGHLSFHCKMPIFVGRSGFACTRGSTRFSGRYSNHAGRLLSAHLANCATKRDNKQGDPRKRCRPTRPERWRDERRPKAPLCPLREMIVRARSELARVNPAAVALYGWYWQIDCTTCFTFSLCAWTSCSVRDQGLCGVMGKVREGSRSLHTSVEEHILGSVRSPRRVPASNHGLKDAGTIGRRCLDVRRQACQTASCPKIRGAGRSGSAAQGMTSCVELRARGVNSAGMCSTCGSSCRSLDVQDVADADTLSWGGDFRLQTRIGGRRHNA